MIERVNDLIDLIVLRQALNNPRSSTELNNWMDEKLDNRMEAFTSVNRFLRDMLDKAESKISMLEERHTKTELEKLDLLLQLKDADAQIKLKDADAKSS